MARVPVSALNTESALAYFKRQGRPIVACATAPGGPVAVLRISGRGLRFLESLCGPLPEAGSVAFRSIKNIRGEALDHGLVLHFQSPQSFTGEDVVEFQIHGAAALVQQIQDEVIRAGAELALPGEFSFRAVMNGKMSLAEAEALQSALALPNLAAQGASRLLAFGAEQKAVAEKLEELLLAINRARGRVEAAIDFPEVEVEQQQEIISACEHVAVARASAARLLTAYDNFCVAGSEPFIVILGAPNVGKSTLLNALAGADRALVSEIAGTTRDVVEARVRSPHGRAFRFLDTAGLRQVSGPGHAALEAAGIALGKNAALKARAVILLSPVGEAAAPEAKALAQELQRKGQVTVLEVFSHADKRAGARGDMSYDLRSEGARAAREILTALDAHFASVADSGNAQVPLSRRQAELLQKSQEALAHSDQLLREGRAMELAGEQLRLAEEHLRRALGQQVSEEYIGEIFSQFCLGK